MATRIRLAPGVLDDFDQIVEHLRQYEGEASEARIAAIISALDVLADNPLIGRSAGDDRSELLIGRGSLGYVALYRFLPMLDTALVLAVRGQRESGYASR